MAERTPVIKRKCCNEDSYRPKRIIPIMSVVNSKKTIGL